MAFIASLFAIFIATCASTTISTDSHGEAPVRRMPKAHSEAVYQAPSVPASLEAVAGDHEGEGDENQEVLSLSALHKDWPQLKGSALPANSPKYKLQYTFMEVFCKVEFGICCKVLKNECVV